MYVTTMNSVNMKNVSETKNLRDSNDDQDKSVGSMNRFVSDFDSGKIVSNPVSLLDSLLTLLSSPEILPRPLFRFRVSSS